MERKKPKPLLNVSPQRNYSNSSFSSTQSTATIVQKAFVPDFVNNNNLRQNLNRTFDTRGEKQLGKILDFRLTVKSKSPAKRKSLSVSTRNPNDLIMQEFFSISSRKVWKEVVENFKNQPKALIRLISSSSRSKNRRKLKKTPKTGEKVQNTEKVAKIIEKVEGFDSEDEVVTFKSDDFVPEDWSKSLLCWKVKKEVFRSTFYPEDIQKSLSSMPRTQEGLEKGIEKGLHIIETFLLEMLGTEEDMDVFKSGASPVSLKVYENLFEKCLQMSKMRLKAVKILKLVLAREELMKNLPTGKEFRTVASQICSINRSLKPAIVDWEKDKSIPFRGFIFDQENYLWKIEKDNLVIQKSLLNNLN